MLTRICWSCCSRGQTPLNRRKSAAPEMLLGENDDEKEKENLRTQVRSSPEFLETLYMVPLYSKGTRPLTFENFLGRMRTPRQRPLQTPSPRSRKCSTGGSAALLPLPREKLSCSANASSARQLVSLTPSCSRCSHPAGRLSSADASSCAPGRPFLRHRCPRAAPPLPLHCPQISENKHAPTSSALRIL